MLYVGIVKETSEYSEVANIFDANKDGTIGSKIAEVELSYDFGDTLADVDVLSGALTEEQIDEIYSGCAAYFEEETV